MKIINVFAGDLKNVSEGGIATYIREIIKGSDGKDEIALVGVTGEQGLRAGIWHKRSLGGRHFSFLPLLYTPERHATYERGMPLNAGFLASLFAHAHKIAAKDSVLYIHRPELALPFIIPFKKTPIAVFIHGASYHIELAKKHPLFGIGWFRKLYYWTEKFVISKVDRVIFVSAIGIDYYSEKFPALKNKFMLISPAVDTELFKPVDKLLVRKKFGFRDNDKILLFAGRFDEAKDVGLLLSGFKMLKNSMPEARLLLAGEGAEKDRLQRFVIDEKISGVEFLGMIEHDKLPEMMNCADIFVLTSLFEGLPLVALEALSCGVPVVATDVGHLNKVIKDGRTGYLIYKRDANEVKEKIEIAVNNAEAMKKECRDVAVSGFSTASMADKVSQIFSKG